MFKTSLITVIAAAASLAAASPSLAATSADATSFKVSTAGLDLNTVSGGHMMLGRINAGATQFCGGAPVIADLAGTQAYNSCINETVRQAVSQMHQRSVDVAYAPSTDRALAANGH